MQIFDSMLLKVVSVCNLNCTYCYWFRDKEVYRKPKILDATVEKMILIRLRSHIAKYGLKKFTVILHGGEPLMFGKSRFRGLSASLRELEQKTECAIDLRLVTNGTLLDKEWVDIFKASLCKITVSIDPTKVSHDSCRVDLKGKSSYKRSVAGLNLLQQAGFAPGVLAVFSENIKPNEVFTHFLDDLKVNSFDVLFPDLNHDNERPSLATFYKEFFDLWYDGFSKQGVSIRTLENFILCLFGKARTESIGYGPIRTLTVLTDGSLEVLDVLRIAGDGHTASEKNIIENELQEVEQDLFWQRAYEASVSLPEVCQKCPYRVACGGGYLPHRWSSKSGYDNPSIYCDDIKAILGHVEERIHYDLKVEEAHV